MRRLFTTLLLAALSIVMVHAATKPDFRYPKTEAKTAESDLKVALKAGDGEGIVDALVRYSLAWSMISEENLEDITSRIEQVANHPTTTTDVRALLLHLEARVLEEHPNRWQHLESNTRIDSLYEASMADLPALKQYPITNYKQIITPGGKDVEDPWNQRKMDKEELEGLRLLPTLAEFLVFYARQHGHLHSSDERRQYLQQVLEKERADSIEEARVYRERQFLNVSRPDILGSTDSLRLEIKYRNLDQMHLEVLQLSEQQKSTDDWKLNRKQMKSVYSTDIDLPDSLKDVDLKQIVKLPPLPYGQYVLDYSFIDRTGSRQKATDCWRYEVFRVTDIEEVCVKLIDRNSNKRSDTKIEKLHLDRQSGKPLDSLNPEDHDFLTHDVHPGYGLFQDTLYSIQLLTDRGIYRPGEKVYYTAVLQGNTSNKRNLLGGRQLVVAFSNPDGKNIATDTLSTDAFGQAKNSFELPKGEKTGYFGLNVRYLEKAKVNASAWRNIMVSEYKAPTFEIDFKGSPDRISHVDSLFTLCGQVRSLSGVPVSYRDVTLKLVKSSWWRYSNEGGREIIRTIQTDGEGRFSLEKETRMLTGEHPSWRTYVNISAECTNLGGETQSAEHSLVIENEDEKFTETAVNKDLKPVISDPSQLTNDMIPANSSLWIHEMFHNRKAEHDAVVCIGTSVPDAYIFYIVSDQLGSLSHGWLHYDKPGLHDFRYPMPQQAPLGQQPVERELKIQFLSMYHGEISTEECRVVPTDEMDNVHIACVSFRDRLIPGTSETWTFRLEGRRLNLTQQQARLMLGLYDHSLDNIVPFRWDFNNPLVHRGGDGFTFGRNSNSLRSIHALGYTEQPEIIYPSWPSLYLYKQNFFSVRTRSKGRILYASATAGEELALEEEVDGEALLEVEALAGNSINGYTSARKNAVLAAPNAIESLTEAAGADAMTVVQYEDAAQSLANVKMREGQTRLALWEPMLTTDSLGQVSITFEVPDQNTTWRMQALALTPWGTYAQLDTTLLSQRPLMVQPSLPRFLRQGDQLNLTGLVLNATEQRQQVTTLVEVYNPRSQQTIASRAIKFQLDKGGQQEVSLNLIVPDTLEQIAFRIRAQVEGGEYGGFGDGEQQMLPVLPAVSPVIETIPFYLNPGDSAFTIELPDNLPEGAKIEMEWCDNPIVYCLEALPSLMVETYPTSSSLAHRLFAYALSEQIVHRYPASLADSLMVQLQKLQNPDGGFSWIDYPERRSSLYATAEVLELFGELQQLGALSKLSSATLVNRALKYYDKQMTDYYFDLSKKNRKKLDVNYFSYYLYLRSLFPDQALSERSQKLFKEALKQSSDRWGELNLAGRAYVALALYRQSPKQQKSARGIVESLRQFSLTHPKRGMYWDQLEYSGYRWLRNVSQTSLLLQTFALIDPHTAELDQIRKWLLLEKQTNSWGNSSLAADAVYALLQSGSEWESGKQIEALKYDSLHDRLLLRDTLSTLRTLPSSTRMVYVPAASPDHPSWGAVYMHYAAPTRTASANSNEELSIQKQLLDANGNVLSLEDLANDSTLLQVGDRVTIRLRITTTREMSEVQVIDERASCFEPVDQLSGYRWGRELGYYQESLDQRTVFLIPRLPRGEHWITYDLHVTSPGQFALGLAKVQCQYAPMFNAHTEGRVVRAEKN